MTPLEALVALNTLRLDYLMLLRETKQLERNEQERKNSWAILTTLTEAVLGPRVRGQLPFLCDVCQQQFAEFYVQEKWKERGGLTWGCASCLKRLRAEGKVVEEVHG